MPELPEVEAARRAIEEHCIGKRIVRAIIAVDAKVIDGGVSPSDFEAALTGKTIVGAHRKGKNMWLQLDSPPFPSFQFGMAGAIYIKGVAVTTYKRAAVSDTDEWPSKYSKFFVELDDGLELSFTDKRRFAKVRLLNNPAAAPPISELGPDALFEPLTADELIKALSKKKIGIKALLLDQSFVSGIGNWIADEVLYQARIHPLQAASSLSKENCIALHKSIKEVIAYAVEVDADCSRFPSEWLFHLRWGKKPGKVIEKAVELGADTSQFPSDWIVHSREKKPGKAFVDGKKIEFIAAGGRTTAYVPQLQILNGSQASKTQIKPRKQAAKGSKDEESAEDSDSAESEEEDKKAKKINPKGRKSTKAQTTKKKKGKNDDEDVGEDPDSAEGEEDDEKAKKIKPKGRKSTTKAQPAKKKKGKNENGDVGEDPDSAESEEGDKKVAKKRKPMRKKITTSSGHKAPPKMNKMGQNDDDNESDGDDNDTEASDDYENGVSKKKTKIAKKVALVNGGSKKATRRK